jgi:hypothetical protein
MASSGKKRTTVGKLTRENKLRERRQEKEARKRERKDAALHPTETEHLSAGLTQPAIPPGEM